MESQPGLKTTLKYMHLIIFNVIWITKSALGPGISFLIETKSEKIPLTCGSDAEKKLH